MSILIKGMKKPKNCDECPLADSYLACDAQSVNCPIIEVSTPHGPLVDTKNLLETITKDAYFIKRGHYKADFGMTCFSIAQAIHEQPIIIEAEEK